MRALRGVGLPIELHAGGRLRWRCNMPGWQRYLTWPVPQTPHSPPGILLEGRMVYFGHMQRWLLWLWAAVTWALHVEFLLQLFGLLGRPPLG